MAGRVLRGSNGQYAGSTRGFGRGRRVAGSAGRGIKSAGREVGGDIRRVVLKTRRRSIVIGAVAGTLTPIPGGTFIGAYAGAKAYKASQLRGRANKIAFR